MDFAGEILFDQDLHSPMYMICKFIGRRRRGKTALSGQADNQADKQTN